MGGNEYDLNNNRALVSRGGLGSSFDQLAGFGFPGYGATLTLNLPIRNRAARQLEEAKLTPAAGKISCELAQKSLAAEQRKYELGAETNYFVLDAQSKMAQADLDLLQTQINYQEARAAVEHATGSLLKPYHIEIKELAP